MGALPSLASHAARAKAGFRPAPSVVLRRRFGSEQSDEDAEHHRAGGGGVPGAGERRDAPPDHGPGLVVDADGRFEREHGAGGRRGSLHGEKVVDAVEGAGQVGLGGEHVPWVAAGRRRLTPAGLDGATPLTRRRAYAALLGTGVAWTIRMLLPDGSRMPASTPYGRSLGSSVNSTPRAESSS